MDTYGVIWRGYLRWYIDGRYVGRSVWCPTTWRDGNGGRKGASALHEISR